MFNVISRAGIFPARCKHAEGLGLGMLVTLLLFFAPIAVAADYIKGNGCRSTSLCARWMIGEWGVRVAIPATDSRYFSEFDARRLADELRKLKTPKWVMLNLTRAAAGTHFTSSRSRTVSEFAAAGAPARDLFGEIASLVSEAGYRVIVYFDAQGPLVQRMMLNPRAMKPGARAEVLAVRQRWLDYLESRGLDHEHATCQIISEFSEYYGTLIDGWWFDHGRFGDASRYVTCARAGNGNAAVGWNENHAVWKPERNKKPVWRLGRSNQYEDFTAGHPTPSQIALPSDDSNEVVISQIERLRTIDGLVPHYFLYLQEYWRGGAPVFSQQRVNEWTSRVVEAGGAITWAIALRPPEFAHEEFATKQGAQLEELDSHLLTSGLTARKP